MRHNKRTPIKASTMRPENLNLRDGERMAVCPDCETWHRLKRSMITPHRDGVAVSKTGPRYYGDKPAGGRRCPGSAQRIEMDITVDEWGARLMKADATASYRHSTPVRRKPKTPPVPAATRMPLVTVSAERARRAFRAHRAGCAACAGRVQIECFDGQRLASAYLRQLKDEPERARFRASIARDRAQHDDCATQNAARMNASTWAAQRKATKGGRKQLAKRSGTAVEERNNTCKLTV